MNPSLEKMDVTVVLLWVLHADKVPPHIGISSRAKFYSLKAKGKDVALPIDQIIRTIDKKKIATLCFHLDHYIDGDELHKVFNFYDKTEPGSVTCLSPIKELLKIQVAEKLTELLDALFVESKINCVYGFHLPIDFDGIKNYDTEQIHSRLRKLSND